MQWDKTLSPRHISSLLSQCIQIPRQEIECRGLMEGRVPDECLAGKWLARVVAKAILGLVLFCGGVSCDLLGDKTIVISAEEFRFTPNRIEWPSLQAVHVILRNQGRERHIFQSPQLFSKGSLQKIPGSEMKFSGKNALVLEPGVSLEFIVQLPAGIYPFRCWIKGHSGMEGTIHVLG